MLDSFLKNTPSMKILKSLDVKRELEFFTEWEPEIKSLAENLQE